MFGTEHHSETFAQAAITGAGGNTPEAQAFANSITTQLGALHQESLSNNVMTTKGPRSFSR